MDETPTYEPANEEINDIVNYLWSKQIFIYENIRKVMETLKKEKEETFGDVLDSENEDENVEEEYDSN